MSAGICVFASHAPDAYFWKSSPGFTDMSRDVRSTPQLPSCALPGTFAVLETAAWVVCAEALVTTMAVEAASIAAAARTNAFLLIMLMKFPANAMR